jgi:hypothetical protein
VLTELQELVDGRDPDSLIALFGDTAILIGTGAHSRDQTTLRHYLATVATQPESLRWEWREVVPYHRTGDALGFAAFGEILVTDARGERRAPFRATIFAVQTSAGWRVQEFHGSIPSDF